MKEAANNAPRFIAAFTDACSNFGSLGLDVPDADEINATLAQYSAGFRIDGDTVVERYWIPLEGSPFVLPRADQDPPNEFTTKPVVEFVAMKLGDPGWAFDSPGLIPRQILDETKTLIGQVAARAGNAKKDVFETFKSHFAAARGESSTYGSSSTSWAETDMYREMDDAAGNAPLFIVAFADGCSQLREEGIGVPSVDRINKLLDQFDAGYQIKGDTLIATKQKGKSVRPPQENPPPPVTGFSGRMLKDEPVQAKAKSLQVFLCHSKGDKPAVKELYKRLKADGYNPWLDDVNLLGGQDWEFEIQKAVKKSEVVLVCLSPTSVTKAGFMQKEIKIALDVADEQPEGQIYIIPVRLEDCEVPARLSKFHWVNLFEDDGYDNVIKSLKVRAANIT